MPVSDTHLDVYKRQGLQLQSIPVGGNEPFDNQLWNPSSEQTKTRFFLWRFFPPYFYGKPTIGGFLIQLNANGFFQKEPFFFSAFLANKTDKEIMMNNTELVKNPTKSFAKYVSLNVLSIFC